MFQMKEQDKTPQEQLRTRQAILLKENLKYDSKDDLRFWNKNGDTDQEDARNI